MGLEEKAEKPGRSVVKRKVSSSTLSSNKEKEKK